MSEKLWQGRFSENTDTVVERFTSSIDFDKRLYPYDIQGSIAHCRMLEKTGIVSAEDAEAMIRGLEEIKDEIERGQFHFDDSLEDIHMHVESRLIEKIGDVARKLHTARSRNDQVALDVRMFVREETLAIIRGLVGLRKCIVESAKRHIDVLLPGYTHLQRAQPVLLSHHLMAYYEMFSRDTQRFRQCMERTDVMPLGSAALAGTTFPIDREYTAGLLGFSRVSENSIDAVSDRDFIIEFLSSASICMMHLSRFSEELILWSSVEFGFVEISDAFTTGSSIMPQKKNPDVPELVRGKAGQVFGNLVSVLTLMKSLPLAYNRDMQEDKTPLFQAVDTLAACIEVYTRMLPHITFNKDVMQHAAAGGFLNATDMADYLVKRGMPFRNAHSCVGNAVRYAGARNKELDQLTLEELRSFSELIEQDIFAALTPRAMIDGRKCTGATAEQKVIKAIQAAEDRLKQEAQA